MLIIVISHNKNTLGYCDKIFRLQNKELKELNDSKYIFFYTNT